MKRLYTLFALMAMLFAACGEQPAESVTPQPEPDVKHLSVGVEGIISMEAEGGIVAIPYTITEPVVGLEVEATTEQDWIGDISVEAEVVSLFVDVNNSAEQRVGMITIKYGQESVTLAIQQTGAEVNSDIVFNITTERKMTFTAKGGEGVIAYTIEDAEESNPQPSAEVAVDWLHIGEISAEEIKFTVDRNTMTDKRSTKITLAYKGAELTLFVDQNAASNEVTLKADKTTVKSDDEVTFTVIYEGEDVTASSTVHANYTNEEVANPYTVTEIGTLSFYAMYNGIKSKICSVTVVPAYAP